MKSRKLFIVSVLLMLGSLGAYAQEETQTEVFFNPHWYLQAQVGGQYTLGEIAFSDLLSPNAQIGVGYQFNPVVGTRLAFNFWQSKAGSELDGNTYKWNWSYLAPAVDATFDLTNLIGGYIYDRVCSVSLFAGIGGNFRLGEGNSADVYASIPAAYQKYAMEYYKDGNNKASLLGRAGLMLDFRLGDRVKLGLEFAANGLSDKYNYKKAGNIDWYFNGLIGLKIALGRNGDHTTQVVPVPAPVERIVEKVVEVQVPCPEAPSAQEVAEPLRRDIFFTINSSAIDDRQMSKIQDIADYLQKHPAATVKISGYADAKTGTAAVNDALSKRRANSVGKVLKEKYNIPEDRIFYTSYGSTVQPFADNDSNRVSICIAE